MRAAGVSNGDLADSAGVHVKTVSNWLSDKQIPEEFTLEQIAERLGVSTSWLHYGPAHASIVGDQGLSGGVDISTAITEAAARYGDIMVRVPMGVGLPEDLPSAVRASIRHFEAELTAQGAHEYEIEFVRRILTAPEQLAFFMGGADAHEDREAALLRGLNALMEGLRAWYKAQHPESR